MTVTVFRKHCLPPDLIFPRRSPFLQLCTGTWSPSSLRITPRGRPNNPFTSSINTGIIHASDKQRFHFLKCDCPISVLSSYRRHDVKIHIYWCSYLLWVRWNHKDIILELRVTSSSRSVILEILARDYQHNNQVFGIYIFVIVASNWYSRSSLQRLLAIHKPDNDNHLSLPEQHSESQQCSPQTSSIDVVPVATTG